MQIKNNSSALKLRFSCLTNKPKKKKNSLGLARMSILAEPKVGGAAEFRIFQVALTG
jgi:hypothetical protein